MLDENFNPAAVTVDQPAEGEAAVSATTDPDSNPETLPALDELPDDVRSLVEGFQKQWQSGMTKERMKETEQVRSLEEKAKALDRLLADPEYAMQFFAANGAKKQEQPTQQAGPAPKWRSVKAKEAFADEETLSNVQGAAYEVLMQEAAPLVQELMTLRQIVQEQVLPFVNSAATERQSTEWTNLAAKFPGADKHKEAVVAFRKDNPKASLEQALYAVAGPTLRASASPSKTAEDKQRGSLFNGSTSGRNRPMTDMAALIRQARASGVGET